MKRTLINAIAPVAVLLACAAWTISVSVAQEPAAETEAAAPAATETPATKTPAVTTTAPAQMQEISDAVERFKARDIDGALKLLKDAAKKNPELPPAHVILAQIFAQANVPVGVRNALERAVVESPNDPEAYMLLADIASRERPARIVEARMLFEKADSLLGKFDNAKRKAILAPQVCAGLAMTCAVREDWAGAQKHLQAWLKLDPKSTAALEQLAVCMLHQKNETGALEQLVQATTIDPKLLSPEATVAQFYAKSGDQEKANKWMISALNAKPKDINVRLLAAQWAWETGQLAVAEKQAAAAMQLDSQSVDALVLRGVIALFQKNYKAAEEYFQTACNLSPKSFNASNNLALALIEQPEDAKKQRALEYAESNAQRFSKTPEAFSTYGWVLYKLGRYDDAEKALRAATSAGSFSPDTAYFLARVLAKRGNNTDAKQLLDSALRSKGPFAQRDDAQSLLNELKK